MVIGIGFPSNESYRKQQEAAQKRLHENKMKLLEGVAESVRRDSERRELPKNDPMSAFFRECSAKERLIFKKKLVNYANEMERCTAHIEARLARQAIEDFDKGDYQSSRLKRYEYLVYEILE